MQLWDGEFPRVTMGANLMITPRDHGLSESAFDDYLELGGIKGLEAMGGRFILTNCRVIFKAHSFNRLRGSLSVPLPAVTKAVPWRQGVAVGIEVCTDVAAYRVVMWRRKLALNALLEGRASIGEVERQLLAHAQRVASDWRASSTLEAANRAATALRLVDRVLSADDSLGFLSLTEHS